MERVAEDLNVEDWEDWYRISTDDLTKRSGKGLLDMYGGSLCKILKSVYPDREWKHWKFEGTPLEVFKDEKVQREFMEELAKNCHITNPEDWYQVKAARFREIKGGSTLLKVFNGSPTEAITLILKEFSFDPRGFISGPSNPTQVTQQLEAMEHIRFNLGVKEMKDWYKVTKSQVLEHRGGWVLKIHGNSLYRTLCAIYPHYPWKDWRFAHNQNLAYWGEKNNLRSFLDDFANDKGIKDWEEWYQITRSKLIEYGEGSIFLKPYQDKKRTDISDFLCALMMAYPDKPWDPTRFKNQIEEDAIELAAKEKEMKEQGGAWLDRTVQRNFFDRVANSLGLKEKEDWYKVSFTDFVKMGGSALLKYHDNSLTKAIMAIYPEYTWKPWRFQKISSGLWNDRKVQRYFMDDLGKKLNYRELDDWYLISKAEIADHGGGSLLSTYGNSIYQLLNGVFTEKVWDSDKFQREVGYWSDIDNQRKFFDRMKTVSTYLVFYHDMC